MRGGGPYSAQCNKKYLKQPPRREDTATFATLPCFRGGEVSGVVEGFWSGGRWSGRVVVGGFLEWRDAGGGVG